MKATSKSILRCCRRRRRREEDISSECIGVVGPEIQSG